MGENEGLKVVKKRWGGGVPMYRVLDGEWDCLNTREFYTRDTAGQTMTGGKLEELADTLDELQDAVEDLLTLHGYSDGAGLERAGAHRQSEELLALVNETFHQLGACKDVVGGRSERRKIDVERYNSLLDRYAHLLEKLDSVAIKLSPYRPTETLRIGLDDVRADIDRGTSQQGAAKQPSKSVRFKNNIVESSPVVPFAPYRDAVHPNEELNRGSDVPYSDSLLDAVNEHLDLDSPTIDMSNKGVFIHNQRMFDRQDSQLDQLHTSVKQQRQISMAINDEVSDQFVLMDDLEHGLDASNSRMVHSNNKLLQYRQALKKRGDWICIFLLIFILLFLLIVVK